MFYTQLIIRLLWSIFTLLWMQYGQGVLDMEEDFHSLRKDVVKALDDKDPM